MAPIIKELKRQEVEFKVCVTAQHREMLDQVLTYFEIVPDYDLDLMVSNQTLNLLSSKVLKEIDPILVKEKPTLVLVHGDTTSSILVALASFHRGIKIGHVEAGLRTYNKKAPFPEEMYRQITSKLSDFHFAPTNNSASNLKKELVPEEAIFITGNTIVDALEWSLMKMKSSTFSLESASLTKIINTDKKLILVTGHRRENFGNGLENICNALLDIAKNENIQIVYPVHLNRNVQRSVYNLLKNKNNIFLIDPVSYSTMLCLMQRSDLIISDSGGIQEEAPYFGKSVLVTREITERIEGISLNYSILVGTNRERIVSEAKRLLSNPESFSGISNPFGDGNAAKRIVNILRKHLC
jgi:UDP-N-acetylglucosamine 2-epimerase (non-hydrolysing)